MFNSFFINTLFTNIGQNDYQKWSFDVFDIFGYFQPFLVIFERLNLPRPENLNTPIFTTRFTLDIPSVSLLAQKKWNLTILGLEMQILGHMDHFPERR